jgi:hypothetical protein
VDDPGGFDLPERRLFRIVLAGLAGGVDAVLHDRVVASCAIGARGGKAGVVDGFEPQRIDESRRGNRR